MLAAALALGVLLAPAWPHAASAASGRVLTLAVTTTADEPDVTPLGGPCADASHRCSIRAALEIADARQVPVTVTIPRGTYVVSTPLLADDAAGVTLVGRSRSNTVLSGGATVVPLLVGDARSLGAGPSNAAVSLAVEGLTVAHGTSAASGTFAGDGGCLVVASANAALTLSRAAVRGCSATALGGGVYSVGRLTIVRSSIDADRAVSGGGGVYQEAGPLDVAASWFDGDSLANPSGEADGGGLYDEGVATVTSSTFRADRVVGDSPFGGGLDLLGTATVTDVTVEANSVAPSQPADATDGAGMYAVGPVLVEGSSFLRNVARGRYAYGGGLSSEGGLVLTGSTLTANVARGTTGGYGGGLYAEGGATVTDCRFLRDVAASAVESYGGGLYVQDSTSIVRSAFVSDTAANGVGGGVFAAGVGTYVDGSTFVADHASGGALSSPSGPGFGGGLAADGATRVLASVVSDDRADQGGGGVYVDAPVELDSTLVQSNHAVEGAGIYDYWVVDGEGDAVVDNTAAGAAASGGGLFEVGFVGTGGLHRADLRDSVVAGNVAPVAGGIEFQGGSGGAGGGTFEADRLAGNRTPSGAPSECAFGADALRPLSLGGNVTGDASCALHAPGDRIGPRGQGYWLATSSGELVGRNVSATGRAGARVAGIGAEPGDAGCLVVLASGVVRAVGRAHVLGDARGLGRSVATGIAVTPDGRGYWVVTSTGAVVAFGDASRFGGTHKVDVVAIARSVDGRGYELLSRDGAVRALGDAPRLGSPRGIVAVALAMTPDGAGYWLLSSTGRVLGFGDARSYGGATIHALAILPTPDGRGYLLVSTDGRVLARGDAHDPGSRTGTFVAAATT